MLLCELLDRGRTLSDVLEYHPAYVYGAMRMAKAHDKVQISCLGAGDYLITSNKAFVLGGIRYPKDCLVGLVIQTEAEK